jgi:acetylornithine deacetylase/succinyl-diaminopimelate desuccinylase-like protein
MLSEELHLPALKLIDAAEYYRKLAFSPSMNISGLISGYTGLGLKTIIPAKASAKIDCRLVADQSPEGVATAFRDHLIAAGYSDARIDVLDTMPPYRLDLDHQLVEPVIAAVRIAACEEPVVWPSLGGTIPQSVFHNVLDLPCLWSAYANWDQGNHGPNENISIACFLQGIAISASVLSAFGR